MNSLRRGVTALVATGTLACGGETGNPSSMGCAVPSEASETGFRQNWSDGVYTVLSASQHLLEIAAGPDVLELAWSGPDLADAFRSGDSVTLGSELDWVFVAGPTSAAAILSRSIQQPASLPKLIGPGPGLGYVPACTGQHADRCWVNFSVSVGGVSVERGETRTADGWQVTNVQSISTSQCGDQGDFASIVTALRVDI